MLSNDDATLRALDVPRLENYVDVGRMEKLLLQMGKEFDSGMGLLGLERDEKDGTPRLYPIIPEVVFRPFCKVIRTSETASKACAACDLRCAQCADRREFPPVCHAGLLDLAVPVTVKDRPVAYVFAGQNRNRDITVEQLNKLKALHRKYKIAKNTKEKLGKSVNSTEFQHLFLMVPRKSPEEVRRLRLRLEELAETISSFAQYSHYLTSVQRIGEELVPIRKLSTGLDKVSAVIRNLFSPGKGQRGSTSWSIWIIDEDREGKFLRPAKIVWPRIRQAKAELGDGQRLYFQGRQKKPHTAQARHPLCRAVSDTVLFKRCNFRRGTLWQPKSYFSRLGSFLAVPIRSENSPLGVIQIGHTTKGAFGNVEAQVARTLAGILASLVRRHNEFQTFAELADIDTRSEASQFVIRKAPAVTLGEKAMVFFWENHGDKGRLVPVLPDLLTSRLPSGRKYYRAGEGLTGWVAHFGLALNISDRSDEFLTSVYQRELKPKLLSKGWSPKEICVPSGRGISRDQVTTSRPSGDRPLLLVPIHELAPKSIKPRPIGVIRVTDKTQGYFTKEDQRVLESLARVIALCHERDKYRSNFVEKATYCLTPTMHAIDSRARRLGIPALDADGSRDYEELQSLVEFLRSIFRTLAYSYLDERFPAAWKAVDLYTLVQEVLQMYRVYANCMHDKPSPIVKSVFKCPSKHVVIKTNDVLLRIAVLHLLDNAFKACKSRKRLQVKIRARNGQPAITVIDDGKGMTREQLRNIGEMFVQYEYEQGCVMRGTGIGLAATKDIILKDLKGRLVIETKSAGSPHSLVRDFERGEISKSRCRQFAKRGGTVVTIVLPRNSNP